jgi:prevent-host-death family protein
MRSIGIRELRQNASDYLRSVEGGETIQVTDRGRPIALLVPIPMVGRLESLAAMGRLARASGDLLELEPPLAPTADVELPSEALEKARVDER